jgi:hypothetical protein
VSVVFKPFLLCSTTTRCFDFGGGEGTASGRFWKPDFDKDKLDLLATPCEVYGRILELE